MKVDVPKPKVKATLVLDEDELIMLAQLAGQVAGDSPRSQFYGRLHCEIMHALDEIHVELPMGRDHFAIHNGRFYALPLPAAQVSSVTPVKP